MRFTVRRPASAEVSPCCHRPPGGDVACCVHISVARSVSAGFAVEDRLALAVSDSDVPAHRASLRRERGRDLFDPTTGLVLQPRGEQSPPTTADTTVQPAFLRDSNPWLVYGAPRRARHRPHVERFDADRLKPSSDIGGGLFDPVFAAVSLARFEFRDRHLRARTAIGAALRAGQALLEPLQPRSLTAIEAGGVQQFTGRQGGRDGRAAIDTHDRAITGAADRLRGMGERDVPATRPVTGDAVGLHACRYRARQTEPHPADLRHPHPGEAPVDLHDVTRGDPDLAEALMHTGFAPAGPAVSPGEKVAHRLGEIPQCLLLHCLRARRQPRKLGACRGQLSTLLVVARRTAPGAPMLLLLNRQIPHIPGVTTVLSKPNRLLGSRKQPVARHSHNVATTTDNTPKGDAAFRPPAQAGGFHAATVR